MKLVMTRSFKALGYTPGRESRSYIWENCSIRDIRLGSIKNPDVKNQELAASSSVNPGYTSHCNVVHVIKKKGDEINNYVYVNNREKQQNLDGIVHVYFSCSRLFLVQVKIPVIPKAQMSSPLVKRRTFSGMHLSKPMILKRFEKSLMQLELLTFLRYLAGWEGTGRSYSLARIRIRWVDERASMTFAPVSRLCINCQERTFIIEPVAEVTYPRCTAMMRVISWQGR